MDYNRSQILDGSFSYATYELKNAPFGMQHARYTTPRNPDNPAEPTYTLDNADIRARARAHAINHMRRYADIADMEKKIRAATSQAIQTVPRTNLNSIFAGEIMLGNQLNTAPAAPADNVEELDSAEELDSDADPDSDNESVDSATPDQRLQPPLFENLPESVFDILNSVNYRSLEDTTAAILTLTKNKIEIQNTTDAILKYELTEYDDISHLSRRDADQLLKLLICALSGRVYTVEQFEQASARLLRQVYGVEVIPVFMMLLHVL